MTRWQALALGGLLVAQFLVRGELSLRGESPIWDERLHLRYGLTLLDRGPAFGAADHPYPATALLALPADRTRGVTVEDPAVLWPARRANLALALLALVALALAVGRLATPGLGLATLFVATLDPAWIAQARYVTTDVALGTAFGIATLAAGRWRGWPTLVAVAVAGGLALSAKLSALLLPPAVFLAMLASEKRVGRAAAAAACTALGGAALYLGAYALSGAPPATIWHHVHDGFVAAIAKRSQPQGVFLLGDYYPAGTFLYYPVVLAAKTPLALLAMLVAALGLREARATLWRARAYAVVPLVYLAVAVAAKVNLGPRHLTPVLPAIWVAAAVGLRALPRGGLYAAALGLLLALEVGLQHPHYLAFTNQAFGGLDGAHRVAVGSASDWGQDLPALADYLARHPPDGPPHLAYFGNADPSVYVGATVWRPCGATGAPPRGPLRAGCGDAGAETLAVSATCLAGAAGTRAGMDHRDDCWAWLRDRPPTAILGGSILIYRNGR